MELLVLSDLDTVFYTKTGFLALLLYDSLLQIEHEYRFIWKSRWTLIKCLYLWTRYIAIFNGIMSLVNSTACNKVTTFITISGGFTISVTEMILMVRTYTLYERSKKLLLFFFVVWFGAGGFAFWDSTQWAKGGSFLSSESDGNSCWFTQDNRNSFGLICYLTLLIGESVIVLLTLGLVLRKFFRNLSGLFKSLYCDGIWYFIAILPWTIATVVILLTVRPGLNNIPDTPLLAMHAILACRLVLHARQIAAEEDWRESRINKIFGGQYMISDIVVDIRSDNQV
ncbi:hypothetical protein R3P38DRAFT_1343907 [Favolaschia claudopus]|uniref:DUF6533 domain-containing protein n=1 Tax=Favolaschia claudopus TaxID=2862362 RepID=A0AAW0DUZ0_9AGAR